MATVAELGFSPVKAAMGYDFVTQIQLGFEGVVDERAYALVEAETHTYVNYKKGFVAEPGTPLTLREDPSMTKVHPDLYSVGSYINGLNFHTLGSSNIFISQAEDIAENRIPVNCWGWRGEAVDQGNGAAEFLSEIIGRKVRLVRISDEKPRYVEDDPALGRVGFADTTPLSIGSTESLAFINKQLASQGQEQIPARRARVSMLLDGLVLPSGYKLPENAFPEDYIKKITIASDGLVAVIKRHKACGRCPVPDTNHLTGERKGRPVLSALGKLGRAGRHADTHRYGYDSEIFWTQGFVIELPEDMPKDGRITIAHGDEVEVEYSQDTNFVPRTKKAA